jgi:hypothetical protein
MQSPRTVADFYSLMMQTRDCRRRITRSVCSSEVVPKAEIALLRGAYDALLSLPSENGQRVLSLDGSRSITLDLSYEITEMEKDIFYVTHSEDEFISFLEEKEKTLRRDVESCSLVLRSFQYLNFITDRDGTVNNYCGRYASSIQSVYNAVFLTCFARSVSGHSIILTSAPLDNIGLVDLSVNPAGSFLYAGSKGREYFTAAHKRRQFPIEAYKQKKLDELNAQLSALVKEPRYEKYSLIGSGLQFKFGQTTIARQDISRAVPEDESREFLHVIESRVSQIDPGRDLFRIEDTGKDIEIILTLESSDGSAARKDFDKGDGIEFLNRDSGLHLEKGTTLICGDTASDVPMVVASERLSAQTQAVFVTSDRSLREKVLRACARAVFVSSPDALVLALYKQSQSEKE